MSDEFEVPAGELRHETPPVKGSRFLASIAPAETVEEAEAYLAGIRAEAPEATHHCWAYRIGRPCDRFRFSDDGEPGGSAGRPILQQIEGHGLTDTICVVTRWYGGTKLGVGGLIRAYGGCAARALDLVPRRVRVLTSLLRLDFPYDCAGAVEGFLAAHSLAPRSSDYGAAVRLVLEVPRRDVEALSRELRDRTAGRVEIDEEAV
ncbi:MAG: YigZ family protein [Planctomycetota bacterium]